MIELNLKQWIEIYYKNYMYLTLKSGTVNSYLRGLNRVPDDWEYETVTRFEIQNLINKLADELAPSTVRHIFLIIKKPLEDGKEYGFTDKSDVVTNIKLP